MLFMVNQEASGGGTEVVERWSNRVPERASGLRASVTNVEDTTPLIIPQGTFTKVYALSELFLCGKVATMEWGTYLFRLVTRKSLWELSS